MIYTEEHHAPWYIEVLDLVDALDAEGAEDEGAEN